MKVSFSGDTQGILEGIRIFTGELGFDLDEKGIRIRVERRKGNIEVGMQGEEGYIRCQEKIHFFRALGLFIEAGRRSSSFSLVEEPQFTMNGTMVDVSRNAVMTVANVKLLLKKMALMGLNMLMLYAEDTYEIKGRPYFGYMRGRYSQDELKDCDDYADIFGIEIIPCIQTLAHLSAALKWRYANSMKDTEDILLVGSEETYAFVEEMITSASAPFRSKRIHIGMDEAHNLGLGKYLDLHGYRRRFDIMNEHLAKVKEIVFKHGLKPMIWSDMYFRLGSKDGEYYDRNANIPQDVIDNISKDAQLVYWDYYHDDEASYREFLRKHRLFGCDILFAGGVWTWNGVVVNYRKTFSSTQAGLVACKKEGVREVFATLWGDNGAETNIFSALLGLQLYAEHGYAKEVEETKLRERFAFCTGGDYDAFMALSKMDDIPAAEAEQLLSPSNPSKFLLWQDILMGLFDRHIEGQDLGAYYAELERKLNAYAEQAGELRFVFDVPAKLAAVLAVKSEVGNKLKQCYAAGDKEAIRNILLHQLPVLGDRVGELRREHRLQWLSTYKPFGWEVLDMRYGGLIVRIETAIFRLSQYVNGEVNSIEELEEERLFFDGPVRPKDVVVGRCNRYHQIVSASPLGFNG